MRVDFSVHDDARFLSHHDMMRIMELAAARAKLPVRFSEGFNPRPKMSLPLPRPVGVEAEADALVVETTERVEPRAFADRLAAETPAGVEIAGCTPLPGRTPLQAVAVDYKVTVDDAEAGRLTERLQTLNRQNAWPVLRQGRGRKPDHRLDLRVLAPELAFDPPVVRFTLVPDGQIWARPSEILTLLEIDSPAARARVNRVAVRWADAPDSGATG